MQYDFGNRFEMIIVMPTKRATEIRILQDYLNRTLSDGGADNQENLLDRIDRELEDPLAHSNEVILTIPEFRAAGNIDANEVLRNVSRMHGCLNRV